MSYSPETRPANRYQPWLWLLSGLFLLRVMAQLAVLFVEIPYLPPFERWHSGTLPYGVLLACQLAILLVMIRVALGISFGRVAPVNGLGAILLSIGTAYFGLMCIRLTLGLTVLSGHHWFTSHIPTVFHLVLATFVLLLGKFHSTPGKECSR